MTWPMYSASCRKDVDALLKKGGSLSAYRANPLFPTWTGPAKDSWAWRLERDAERRFGVRHAIAVNSGTAALHAALAALRLKPGSLVATSPYTFSATTSAILLAGYTPIYADVCPYTFNITPETVKPLLKEGVKAILPVSLFGGMADIHGFKQFGLPVVEDACQAVGARDQHGYSGTYADVGCYSFNGGKNVPAGEAGMLMTNSDKIAEHARLFMNHGENFRKKEIGVNYRIQELVACVAWHGMRELEGRNQRRRDLAKRLSSTLPGIGYLPEQLTYEADHVYYVYPFKVYAGDRPLFIKRMKKRGIYASGGYLTPPLHMFPCFKKYAKGRLPVVEELSFKTLCLINDLTPDRPLSYADTVAEAMQESLK